MTYVSTADLDRFLGDLLLPGRLDVESYIDEAFDHMEIKLGECYATPLPPTVTDERSRKSLEFIQARLAAGNILVAASGTSGDENMNEYGLWLIKEAHERMATLCSDSNLASRLQIPASTASPDSDDPNLPANSTGPRVSNADCGSAVESYYSFLTDGRQRRWYGG